MSNVINIITFSLYLAVLVVIGFYSKQLVRGFDDMAVGGRRFGVLFVAAGTSANIAGGASTVGISGHGVRLGFSGIWFGVGTAMQGIMTFWYMRIIKVLADRHQWVSVGDFFGYRYSTPAKVIAGFVNGVSYLGFTAAMAVAIGRVLQIVLGMDVNTGIIIAGIICIVYVVVGGLPAIIYSDMFQLGIIWLGMVFIGLPLSIGAVGGVSGFFSALPAEFYSFGRVGTDTVIVTILSTALASFVLQASFSYTISARTPDIAQKARALTSFFYIVPTASALVVGMCGLILLGDTLVNPEHVLPMMILTVFPVGVTGLLLAVIPAATMSTFDTCNNCSVSSFVNDVYRPLFKPKATQEELLFASRIMIVVVGLIAIYVAVQTPHIIRLILWGYAFAVGSLIAPMLGGLFWSRATNIGALASMIIGGSIQLSLNIWGASWGVTTPPLFVSLPVSIIVLIVVSLLTPPSDKSIIEGVDWRTEPGSSISA